ncbi:hypothetical protein C7379_12014 [Hallella colorans]|uniref:Uncharacterized protein n=1 Tax=Hallella colorans TaxID=1703337 RepID=A0A2U0U083_9BACT|nr:hypothetical protein C7379_12014 [Hallella colorans]
MRTYIFFEQDQVKMVFIRTSMGYNDAAGNKKSRSHIIY